MPTLLITNDDGIESPTLVPLARASSHLGDVRVVVPDIERSWIGKAISRFDVVRAEETVRSTIPMIAVSGTPADCVSLAAHTLCKPPPDVVVSGINLGLNFGLAFLLSSGTIGAALEAWIAGIPSIAFSMAIPHDAYGLSVADRVAALGPRPLAAAEVAADIAETILSSGFPDTVDCFSVNMPADVDMNTPRVVARITRSRYGPLFSPVQGGGYRHRFQELHALESGPTCDIDVVRRGAIAITPIRLELSATLPPDLLAALEKAG